ncbi:hypothetical protein A3742_07670 [Oleiphilus sp. HI0071]|jgi:uncharacterized membrane protein YfcA|uniref:sulfite exporter TauE/SafE family protein n=1 Tax=unclassified Oleiphilus TaxID=2631174 RepID=UPI0007C23043|nr:MULTISPECIES: sulfite exporter TauE/SafE family protein [unclassified Oleiphilus]KZY62677.1 hypothetical protein A3737_19965 [Oleiphilus sp. HI0065]KZY83246.1 hypothetical protein A3742_07670 [Oleiphilus sp. HI0071]KZY88657.1 hypothetical protein A3744_24220 [Oleiphilus sp. HI0073]KZZ40765.1 hypothetical protein A3758_08595 [Oleiphilus sp. HI0118]KZZ49584.1 hypothetical protein A3760_02625 [Oleiphilus sp. HI0122]KZZ77759.1 hypothetical protein A3767_14230 [Oleiphilus sp. HI0133]
MEFVALASFLQYVLAGAGVGFAVGLTGVGGGSLMTPLLIMFNYPPHIAIGTDLMYAAGTKAGGIVAHARQKTINWGIVLRLSCGSIPASIATVFILKYVFSDAAEYQGILLTALGLMLMFTAAVILLKGRLMRSYALSDNQMSWLKRHQTKLTVVMGVFLGVCVTLSSVGAGAFGAAILMVLYPRLSPVTIIGTDIAHAVPLTLIAGLGHMQLGHIDFVLLASLLCGSIPAIFVGSKLSKKVPGKLLQPFLAVLLLGIGMKYAFF